MHAIIYRKDSGRVEQFVSGASIDLENLNLGDGADMLIIDDFPPGFEPSRAIVVNGKLEMAQLSMGRDELNLAQLASALAELQSRERQRDPSWRPEVDLNEMVRGR